MREHREGRTTPEQIRERLREVPSEGVYYAITLSMTEDGKILTQALTNFAGFADDEYHPNRELRAAAQVDPSKMIALWQAIGQNYMVVRDKPSLFVFLHLGGNGLVEESIARKWYANLLSPREVIRIGFGGWHSVTDLPANAFKHAPTRKQRMRVLKRDRYRCRVCGRSPDNHVDVELHVHHIRPFGREGGVTHDENLITLCQTCHDGLDPHFDCDLFDFVGSGLRHMVEEENDNHRRGVQRYRDAVRASLAKPSEDTSQPAKSRGKQVRRAPGDEASP